MKFFETNQNKQQKTISRLCRSKEICVLKFFLYIAWYLCYQREMCGPAFLCTINMSNSCLNEDSMSTPNKNYLNYWQFSPSLRGILLFFRYMKTYNNIFSLIHTFKVLCALFKDFHVFLGLYPGRNVWILKLSRGSF